MKKWSPTVLYHSKLVDLHQIAYVKKGVQSRISGLDLDNLKNIERSIEVEGLKEEVHVEVINADPTDENKSEYILRSGCHRYSAYKNLKKKHKNSSKYDLIKCVVYEKHTGASSQFDWLQWQHQENEHMTKAHRANSLDDSIFTAYTLLTGGHLDARAANLIKTKKGWTNPLINKVLMGWFKENCRGLSYDERDKMVTKVYECGNQIRNAQIKRYTRAELESVLLINYGIEKSGDIDPCTGVRVYVASEQDCWTKALTPVANLIKDNPVNRTPHHIIFHCRKGDAKHINTRRDYLRDMVKTINAWFKENVPETVLGKGFSPISEIKYLGQKIQLGENPNQLISVKIK